MELTFAQQTTAFLWSIALGVFLGIFYGLLKIIRISASSGKALTVSLDIIFMLVSALSLFMLSLAYLLGFVRIYMFLGSLIGFLLYRITLGAAFSKLCTPIIRFVKKALRIIFIYFKKIAKSLLKIAHKILYNKDEQLKLFSRRIKKSADDKKVMIDNETKK